MSAAERVRNLLERVFLLPMRVRRRTSSRVKYKVRAQTLATTRKTLESLTKLKAEGHRALFNVGLYLILLDQDLADFTDDLVCAIGERRRVFVAKHEAILLYEAAQDLPHLLGRDFRAAVKVFGIPESLQRRLNAASSGLSEFRENEGAFLKKIRNAVAAHRERDALAYLEALEQVKPLQVMARAADLSGRIERLLAVITEIALANSGTAAIVSDMIGSSKRRAG